MGRYVPLYIIAAGLAAASVIALGIGGTVAVGLIAWLRY